MSDPFVATYEDVLERMSGFISARAKPPNMDNTSMRTCVEAALREIVSAHDWNCMHRMFRVLLKGTTTQGNVTYLSTTGTYPYQLTLTDNTFPTWAADASIRIGTYSLICEIDQIMSPTIATLMSNMVPGVDYPTEQPMTLGLERYPLPPEFLNIAAASERNAWFIGRYMPWKDFQQLNKYRGYSGIVKVFSIGPDFKRLGAQCIYVHPWSQDDSEYDLEIQVRPRTMKLSGLDPWNYTGTVSIANGSAVVTGSGTAFDSRFVGTVMRFSGSTTLMPTGTAGQNPYLFQQTVASVQSATQLTLTVSATQSLPGVKYRAADPCDLPASLYDVFIRCCELQVAGYCDPKEVPLAKARYNDALQLARTADLPSRARMVVGENQQVLSRLREFTRRPWI